LSDRIEELDAGFSKGHADGFVQAYYAYSNYRKTIPKKDFVQCIEDLSGDKQRDLDLSVIPGCADSKSDISVDLIAAGSALQYNTFFKFVNQYIVTSHRLLDSLSRIFGVVLQFCYSQECFPERRPGWFRYRYEA
jgi:hypothetical protein